ncbi:MAG: transposase, partial [Desulfobacterales bacterium]
TKPAPTKIHALPEIIRGFKTFSSRRINEIRHSPGTKLWQRNYYEHIIRNDDELNRIREYIVGNPARWESDTENPDAVGTINKNFEDLGL